MATEKWEFSYYSYDPLCINVDDLEQNVQLITIEWEGYESELTLMKVCTGEPKMLQQISLFLNVGIENFARDWSFDYADAKNFSLLEARDGERCSEMTVFSSGSVFKE